jgi:hypothetical protein
MFKFQLDSGSGAGMTTCAMYKWFSGRKAELFMLLKTGSFHFALTVLRSKKHLINTQSLA